VVSTAGAWGVLVLSKFWEGTQGEHLPRRFGLLVAGLGLGAAAWLATDGLLVNLRWVADPGLPPFSGYGLRFMAADGTPLLAGHLLYFGLLLPVLRWWRLADPLRATRLSIWSVAVCSGWAWLLASAWPYPQPWGPMVAATAAVAIQLASPWVDTRSQPA
jgi:hypothetical protein